MFVPPCFDVPVDHETPHFTLRMLRITDVIKDYDAVVSSLEHLKGVFGRRSSWPPADLSLEQNLVDLGWHHKEFQCRSSFAYTVIEKEKDRCLGCCYLYPSSKEGYDAEAYCWVRADSKHLDTELYAQFKLFLAKWPLKKTVFPGRDIEWSAWENLSEKA